MLGPKQVNKSVSITVESLSSLGINFLCVCGGEGVQKVLDF